MHLSIRRILRKVVVFLLGILVLGIVLSVMLLSALLYDGHRVAPKAIRVRPGTAAVTASINSHFELSPGYGWVMADKVPFVPYLLLARRVPRFLQRGEFYYYLALARSDRASMIATYACFEDRSDKRQSVVGMDKAAKMWLGKDWSQVTEADIAELRKHVWLSSFDRARMKKRRRKIHHGRAGRQSIETKHPAAHFGITPPASAR